MEQNKKNIIPKGFFSQPRKTISTKEALKDVIPVNWNEALKGRKENNKQIVKLVKTKAFD